MRYVILVRQSIRNYFDHEFDNFTSNQIRRNPFWAAELRSCPEVGPGLLSKVWTDRKSDRVWPNLIRRRRYRPSPTRGDACSSSVSLF
jgi:hypothetical protein